MEFKDYYAALGIDKSADAKDIKTAYRKLARKYHPDVSKHSDAESKFKEVGEAYAVLKNAEKRAEYDELRQYRSQGGEFAPPPGWESSGAGGGQHSSFDGDFSDFFAAAFGAGGRSNSNYRESRQPFPQRGRDMQIDMPVFLEDCLTETQKPLSYHLNGGHKNLKVKIPAGVTDGKILRLKGQGEAGSENAPSGDLNVRIRVVPHPLFDVEDRDLVITVPLAPWEAALGTKIEVPTLSGKVRLTIPPNSQAGQRLRVRGQGLINSTGRGNLYALLKIVIPDASNEILKEHWQQLSEQAQFDPRSHWSK